MATKTETPVCLTRIGTFLVCPHHLTIATGETHIAYEPQEHLIGFGALDTLVQICTAQLTFQEDATELIAQSLQTHLQCKAVTVMMQATHPCHTLNHPRSHQSRITTWSGYGPRARQQSLRRAVKEALEASPRN
jgi:GTP cyclohydrolase I